MTPLEKVISMYSRGLFASTEGVVAAFRSVTADNVAATLDALTPDQQRVFLEYLPHGCDHLPDDPEFTPVIEAMLRWRDGRQT